MPEADEEATRAVHPQTQQEGVHAAGAVAAQVQLPAVPTLRVLVPRGGKQGGGERWWVRAEVDVFGKERGKDYRGSHFSGIISFMYLLPYLINY